MRRCGAGRARATSLEPLLLPQNQYAVEMDKSGFILGVKSPLLWDGQRELFQAHRIPFLFPKGML